MKNVFWLVVLVLASCSRQEYKLVWSDEFNVDGPVNAGDWNFARGFGYNMEDQWYQEDNAFCENGCLIIEARKEAFPNPDFNPRSDFWGHRREMVNYTSSRINTAEKREFLYGLFEMRAKIPTAGGAWPAFWTLGSGCEYGGVCWPECGEIDIMEYYPHRGVPSVLANVGWYNGDYRQAEWSSKSVTLEKLLEEDPQWREKFHIWTMDWEKGSIKLFLDGKLINETTEDMILRQGRQGSYNPFRHPHYILLNLALGGVNGGPIDDDAFPMRYVIDYVRVYQK
ncbi:MAG: family 16 glycosylhydrolase [Candidatus Cryptobacteroides sp.]